MSHRYPLFVSCAVLALLAGCGTPKQQAPWGGPGTPSQKHPPVRAELPALPAAGSGRGGYYLDDGPGDNPPTGLHEVPDAQVRYEPVTQRGNRPYVVFGKRYVPMTGDEPFSQRGIASWYGKKFHGQKTSSGEIYDMYKMTAAHPTLPLPSYVRVTSVVTGKSVVVRVNDRGPFHAKRVIDLSYTAALKIGLLGAGSHEVVVERLFPDRKATLAARGGAEAGERAGPNDALSLPGGGPGFYLQFGAFSTEKGARSVMRRLQRDAGSLPALDVLKEGSLYRVMGGPFASRADAQNAAASLPRSIELKPVVVRRPKAD